MDCKNIHDLLVEFENRTNNDQKITCTFEAGPLGLILKEYKQNSKDNNNAYIFVESIVPNSQASKFVSLSAGSVLEKVGHMSVEGISFNDLINVLKECSRPLKLTFRKKEKETESKKEEETIVCTFGEGKLGLVLETVKNSGTDMEYIVVSSLIPNGAASKYEKLKVNDIIVAVGDTSVSGKTLENVTDLIRNSKRPLTLSFKKQKEEAIMVEDIYIDEEEEDEGDHCSDNDDDDEGVSEDVINKATALFVAICNNDKDCKSISSELFLNAAKTPKSIELTDEAHKQLFAAIDQDGDGALCLDEFINYFASYSEYLYDVFDAVVPNSENDTEWYYLNGDGETIGPFALTEFINLYKEKTITDQSNVWNADIESWHILKEVTSLVNHIQNA